MNAVMSENLGITQWKTKTDLARCISNRPSELADFIILIFSLNNGLLKEDTRSKK